MSRYSLTPISGNVPPVTLNLGAIVYSGTTGTPSHSTWDNIDYYYGTAVFSRLTVRSSTPIWTSNQQLVGKYGGENFTFEIECTHEFDPDHSASTSGWRTTLSVGTVKMGTHSISNAAGHSASVPNYYVDEGWEPADAGIYAYGGSWEGHDGVWFICCQRGKPENDSRRSNALFLSNSFFEEIPLIDPYTDPTGGGASAGDPSGNGGYGHGFPIGTPAKTSGTKGNVFPFGSGLHAYVITPAQLATFGDYMWGRVSDVFDTGGLWGRFQNYKFNPIAGILSCHSLPQSLMPIPSGSASISIAGTTLALATGSPCGTQFTSVTSDVVSIPEVWASYLDYASASVSIYIPFCGIVPIDISAIMGGGVYVRFYCDVVNGNLSAWIIGIDRNGIEQLLKTASGNCAYHVPITGNDNGAGEIIGSMKSAAQNMITGNFTGALGAGLNMISGTEQHHTETVGNMVGNSGFCASTEIFLICSWTYPVYSDNFNAVRGRPSEFSGTVGQFSGYGEFDVHADFISGASDAEKREIEEILRGGVYV